MLSVALWWLACAGAPERQSFAIAGTVVELKENAVVLDHDDIPGFMAAMVMTTAASSSELEGLEWQGVDDGATAPVTIGQQPTGSTMPTSRSSLPEARNSDRCSNPSFGGIRTLGLPMTFGARVLKGLSVMAPPMALVSGAEFVDRVGGLNEIRAALLRTARSVIEKMPADVSPKPGCKRAWHNEYAPTRQHG